MALAMTSTPAGQRKQQEALEHLANIMEMWQARHTSREGEVQEFERQAMQRILADIEHFTAALQVVPDWHTVHQLMTVWHNDLARIHDEAMADLLVQRGVTPEGDWERYRPSGFILAHLDCYPDLPSWRDSLSYTLYNDKEYERQISQRADECFARACRSLGDLLDDTLSNSRTHWLESHGLERSSLEIVVPAKDIEKLQKVFIAVGHRLDRLRLIFMRTTLDMKHDSAEDNTVAKDVLLRDFTQTIEESWLTTR